MASAPPSPFHSSSDCSTAHVSRRNLDNDDVSSNIYSATSSRPRASVVSFHSGVTPLDSDAFASPASRPPTGVSTSFTTTPATARDPRRLSHMRPPGISILSPPSPSASSTSTGGPVAEMTLPPQQRRVGSSLSVQTANKRNSNVTNHPNASNNSNNNNNNATVNSSSGPSRSDMERSAPFIDFPKASTTSSPKSATYIPPPALGMTSPPAAASTRRALSSPMVPTSRGPSNTANTKGAFHWSGGGGGGGADSSTAAPNSRTLPPLPPLRPPSSYFLSAGSKSNSGNTSRRNGSSRGVSPSSQAEAVTPHSTTQARAPSLHASSYAAPTENVQARPDQSWWASARRYMANRKDQVNSYLETLVNPGAVNLATQNAQTAAAQARTRRASQSLQTSPTSASHGVGGAAGRGGGGGGRHSRTASTSSGFDGAFDVTRRTPPPRPPTSPGRNAPRSIFEPFSSAARQESGQGNELMPLDVVVIDPASEPFVWNDPTIQAPEISVAPRDAANDLFMGVGDVSGSDTEDMGGEPNTYVVDLLSALRGYLSNPTEPFGHLVAAALASRSAEMPVRGFEIAAAEHNPFLVRMIVDSGTLEVQDEEAQRNVQDTVDELIPATEGELSPAIYEYLSSFFKMPFVRLSHDQYALLKRSGFEYIKLMYDHQHVLPDEPFHSILLNASHVMHVIHIVFMIIQLLSHIFCTVTIALVLACWMKFDNNSLQSYGFYTLIVFGGGWALYLIFIIYAVRSRQDEQRYEPQDDKDGARVMVPSPFVSVVPVIPLFDIMCVVSYCIAVKRKRMILGHNIVACSRLSGAFFAVWFAFPQLIAQSYFNNIELSIAAEYRHRWAYTMLIVAVICQWGVALLGYVGFLFTHDSIDGFGFACFNMGRVPHLLERHNAAAHVLHYLMAFVLETNVYLVAADTINRPIPPPCDEYSNTVLGLSSFSVFYMLVVYLVICATDASTVRISFTAVVLLAVQVALCVCSERIHPKECTTYRHYFFRGTFVFGYLAWGAYFALFVVWLIMMLQWMLLCHHKLNLFPRVLWPYARRDERFSKANNGEKAVTEPEVSSQAAADDRTENNTV